MPRRKKINKHSAGHQICFKDSLKLNGGFMASSNTESHSKTSAVLLAAPHISGGNKEGLQHRTDSPPYRRTAWTTFDQRERSESHASVIPGDKGRGFEFKSARAEPTGSVVFGPHSLTLISPAKIKEKKKNTGDSVCFAFLMTDEDKNVKNRICVVHLHFNSCFFFFCKLLGITGLRVHFCLLLPPRPRHPPPHCGFFFSQ